MGAEFCLLTESKSNTPEDKLLAFFGGVIDECKYESGHGGYSGTFAEAPGLIVTDKVFSDSSEAEDWLGDNAKKWEPALAVSCGDNWMIGAVCSS